MSLTPVMNNDDIKRCCQLMSNNEVQKASNMVHASMQRTEEEGRYWCGCRREKIRHNAHTVCFDGWKRATEAEMERGTRRGASRMGRRARKRTAGGWRWRPTRGGGVRQRSPTLHIITKRFLDTYSIAIHISENHLR